MKCSALALGILLPTLSIALAAEEAQPETPGADVKAISPLRKLMDESIDWYELYPNNDSTAVMVPRIVMRWANNARGSEDGMTILYILNGRPEAVCCCYPWEKTLQHNFESLSRSTLIGKRDGTVVWRPEKPGVEFRPIPNAPVPAETPAARLRQMKTLATQFSSTMLGWNSDSSDREQLRMLPQPLYRYEIQQRPDLLDGCIFAFVQGTDPESLLLIEAAKQGDKFEWQYGFVRRTSGELDGRFEDTVVWHANRYPISNNPRSTYITLARPLDQL